MTLTQSLVPSERLADWALSECVNLTVSPPIESFNPLGEPALEFRGTENAQDPLSMRSHLRAGEEENNDPLPSVEELLGDAGGAQSSQHIASYIDHGSRKADGAAEFPILIACDDTLTPTAIRSEGTHGDIDGRSDIRPGSDSSVSIEQSAKQGAQQGLLNTSAVLMPGLEVRDFALLENARSSLSDPPSPLPPHLSPLTSPLSSPSPPPPPPSFPPPVTPSPPSPLLVTDTVLSSIFETQTESSGDALNDIEPGPSDEEKEKANMDNGHNKDESKPDGDWTAVVAISIRDSSKRMAGNADINKGGEGMPRSAKVRRIDPIDAIDHADEEMSDLEFARLRAMPKAVFRMPPSWRDFQQCENTAASPSRSSETGDSQENPLMVGDDDDDEKPGENGGSTRATNVESKLGPATPFPPPPPEKAETHARLSTCTPKPTTEPVDRAISPSAALPEQIYMGDGGADDRGAAAVATPPRAGPPPTAQPSPAPAPAPVPTPEEEEDNWEIRKIVGKRRVGKGYEYRVRWKDIWLPRSELGNAQRLLKEFEAQHRAQPGSKARKNKF